MYVFVHIFIYVREKNLENKYFTKKSAQKT